MSLSKERLEELSEFDDQIIKQQAAEIERKDALLRECLDVIKNIHAESYGLQKYQIFELARKLLTSIKTELGAQA